jgi:hypothetical protein
MADNGDVDLIVLVLDLRDVRAFTQHSDDDGEPEMVFVLTDGHIRIELTGGVTRHSQDAIQGAQRLAEAALDYAAGLAMLAMPDQT